MLFFSFLLRLAKNNKKSVIVFASVIIFLQPEIRILVGCITFIIDFIKYNIQIYE